MDTNQRLTEAATHAQIVLLRMAGEGSILDQIANGAWSDGLVSDQAASDLIDLLEVMSEHVRHARAAAGLVQDGFDPHPYARTSAAEMADRLLPLNRKERFYTGTVLPMITASDGFAHLHRLLRLCGLPQVEVEQLGLDGMTSIQFTTEYSFVESLFTEKDRARFANAPTNADTPDVVIAGPDWLLAIEAKMFHNPLPEALNHQMQRQQTLLDYWTAALSLDPARVRHVLLLPEALPVGGVQFPVVTWEAVLKSYEVVGPAYWTAALAVALDRYADTVSRSRTFGANAEKYLTGQEIVTAHAAGTLDYHFMGRLGGLHGSAVTEDVETGRWRTQTYEVREAELPGKRNWFSVMDFVSATASAAG